jgi:hypothetical protein
MALGYNAIAGGMLAAYLSPTPEFTGASAPPCNEYELPLQRIVLRVKLVTQTTNATASHTGISAILRQ